MRHNLYLAAALPLALAAAAPLGATVAIQSVTPSLPLPQPLGTPITWTVTAVNSNPNPLTFQFNVASGGQPFQIVRDFNVGSKSAGIWTAQPFTFATIAGEG